MATPDILALLRTYLDGATAVDVKVATRVPSPRPGKLVQLRLIGWPKMPPVRRVARVDVFAWGADVGDEIDAMSLGITVMGLVNALARTTTLGVEVYRVEETLGLRQSDDPATGIPRAWATYAITHRDETVVY